jgi:hypothetical protein
MAKITGPYSFSAMHAPGGTTDAELSGLHLPAIECETCGQRTVEIGLALPSVKIPHSVPLKYLRGNPEVTPVLTTIS